VTTNALTDTYIGPAHHPVRNYLFIVGAIVMGLIAGVYTWRMRVADGERAAQLEAFRAQYGQTCRVVEMTGAAPALTRDLFVRSARLQAVVSAQAEALREGASCEEVTRALRAADFPLPPPVPEVPSITLQPGGP
jgi:hypothetical protein